MKNNSTTDFASTFERLGCLRRFRAVDGDPKIRLILFPCAGAGANIFKNLSLTLPTSIDPLVVQLAGREDRISEEYVSNMNEIVGEISESIKPFMSDQVVFFGHSMGAFVAYEVAVRMRQIFQWEPVKIIVSSQGGPSAKPTGNRCHHLASDLELIADLLRLGGTPQEVLRDESLLSVLLPTVRADYKLLDFYKPNIGRPFSCGITACAGRHDPEVSLDTLLDWGLHTKGGFNHHWFMGGHFYFSKQLRLVAAKVQGWSDQSLAIAHEY